MSGRGRGGKGLGKGSRETDETDALRKTLQKSHKKQFPDEPDDFHSVIFKGDGLSVSYGEIADAILYAQGDETFTVCKLLKQASAPWTVANKDNVKKMLEYLVDNSLCDKLQQKRYRVTFSLLKEFNEKDMDLDEGDDEMTDPDLDEGDDEMTDPDPDGISNEGNEQHTRDGRDHVGIEQNAVEEHDVPDNDDEAIANPCPAKKQKPNEPPASAPVTFEEVQAACVGEPLGGIYPIDTRVILEALRKCHTSEQPLPGPGFYVSLGKSRGTYKASTTAVHAAKGINAVLLWAALGADVITKEKLTQGNKFLARLCTKKLLKKLVLVVTAQANYGFV
jgi:hypothetical protein